MRRAVALSVLALVALAGAAQATEGHGTFRARSQGAWYGPATLDGANRTLTHVTGQNGSLAATGDLTVTVETTRRYENGSSDQEQRTRSYEDARLVAEDGSWTVVNLTSELVLDAAEQDGYGREGDPSLWIMAAVPVGTVPNRYDMQMQTGDGSADGFGDGSGSGQLEKEPGTGTIRSFADGIGVAPAVDSRHDGAFELILVNGTIRVEDDGDTDRYRSGQTTRTQQVCDQRVGGRCVSSHEETVVVRNRTTVEAGSASLDVVGTSPTDATMTIARGPTLALDGNGTLHVEDATGRIVVGEETFTFENQPVTVGGVLDVELQQLTGERIEMQTGDGTWSARYADGYDVALEGDIRYVRAPETRTFPPEVVAGAAAGVGLGIAALAVYLWPALKFAVTKLFVVPMYAQVEGDDVLDNETRATIFEGIKDEPGMSATELADHADCGWGTVVYHLAVLEQNDLVISSRDGRHRRFFPYQGMDFRHKDVLSAIRHETTNAILDAIRSRPGIHQKELRKEVDKAASTVNWHISKLEDVDLVEKRRDGRKVVYYPGPKVDLLDEAGGA